VKRLAKQATRASSQAEQTPEERRTCPRRRKVREGRSPGGMIVNDGWGSRPGFFVSRRAAYAASGTARARASAQASRARMQRSA
jgi:hypothetical protein